MRAKHALLMAAATIAAFSSCKKEQAIKSGNKAPKNGVKVNLASQDNTATNFFKRTSGAVAFDQAFSIKLASGKVIWLNGDTYYNDYDSATGTTPCLFEKHNTVLEQPSTSNWTWTSTTTLTKSNGEAELFKPTTAGRYYWPSSGVESGTANTLLVHVNEIQNSGASFTVTASRICTLKLSDKSSTCYNLPALNGINFRAGMFKSGSYVYVYGLKPTGLYGTVYVYLARFTTAAPATWTFFKGTPGASVSTAANWSSNSSLATSLGVGHSDGTNIAPVNGKYVMISTAYNEETICDTITEIYACKSTSITGPFPAMTKIYDIPDWDYGHTPFFYTPIIHPHFQGSNNFFFTYCINNYEPCFPRCNIYGRANPDYYRPRAVRVPFSDLAL